MRRFFAEEIAAPYTSGPQRMRVLTEHWVKTEVYCPSCGNPEMTQYRNNAPVADFFCPACKEDYELKAQRRLSETVVDGAYKTMLERLASSANPNFFLLNYDLKTLSVLNLVVIPKHFFTPVIIQKRKPLAETARRAGWIGCNILLQQVPLSGRIFLIRNRLVEPKDDVLEKWRQTLFLRQQNDPASRGWLISVMRCVERLNRSTFSLDDVYSFESELKKAFPANRHVKEKIRQQLQVLRDKGYLEFLGRGSYRLRAKLD